MKVLIRKGADLVRIGLSILFLVLIGYACNDETPPRAEITVLDDFGVAIDAARVIIYCTEAGCIVSDTATTAFDGVAQFEFKLPAVLKVEAFKVTESTIDTGFPPVTIILGDDSLCGDEFITLITDEVAKKTVIVTNCN